MGDIANRDEADKCLGIAQAALSANNLDKAHRFADKAMKLYPSDTARTVMIQINARRSNGPSVSPPDQGEAQANGTAGLRHRPPTASKPKLPEREKDTSTPEQRELVKHIRSKKDFYEILDLPKSASEDDIKKAYRKLALKLHPDKNKARGADEAFKMVSKAFSCLTDAQKRAAYDRYGDENPTMRRTPSQAGFGGFEDFDPEEIFNMFFNGGFGGGRIYRTQFGGGARRAHPQPQGPTHPLQAFLPFVPVLLILLFTFLSQPGEPVFSLDRSSIYTDEMMTRKFNVPFFVKSQHKFDQDYPPNTRDRLKVETDVEIEYRSRLEQMCHNERVQQQHLFRWGQKERARSMELPTCAELNTKFGYRHYSPYVY